jgi:hypothetical protein
MARTLVGESPLPMAATDGANRRGKGLIPWDASCRTLGAYKTRGAKDRATRSGLLFLGLVMIFARNATQHLVR